MLMILRREKTWLLAENKGETDLQRSKNYLFTDVIYNSVQQL